MPEELYVEAERRQKQLGYVTFSDYIQALIRADVLADGSHLRETVTYKQARKSNGRR